MRRKLIKQGHNTLTITLPSKWIQQFNLKPGSEINLIEKDNGLFLTTEKNEQYKKAEFDITRMDIPTIWKYFMAVYREGYDEVLVRFNENIKLENPYKFFCQHKLDLKYERKSEKKNIHEILQSFVNRFIGFGIIESGKDYCIVKEIGETSVKEFDNCLRRIFLILQQMAEETVEAIKTNNSKILPHIHDVDINLDKFHDYCIRILNKVGNKEPRKSELLSSTLFLLELLGDEFKNISHHLLYDLKKTKSDGLKKTARLIKEEIDALYSLFYKFDIEKINQISKIDKEIYFGVGEVFKKANDEYEKEVLHHLRLISRYINALYELKIEMEF
ncbi:phosphate uptake regulator PhoU [Candidatus Pacearchaeota archaeon]|nr:phosphate uptake regulator PhoU [Candidatus Pacearchaeota archaeon]